MDGDDHEDTVLRRRGDVDGRPHVTSAPRDEWFDDPDPGGLVDATLPRRSIPAVVDDEATPTDRAHSLHAETTVPQIVPTGLPRYRLSVNGDAPLTIDAPTLIGRSPRPPRVPGPRPPRLLEVESGLHEVSATHLEIRQEGSSVIVTDLRSTNGTVVTMPGAAPVRLLPGESMVAVPGSLIDIGDGNVVEILGIERRPADARGRFPL